MKTLLIYSDDIPGLRRRYKQMASTPDVDMICIENWHRPYRFSTDVKAYEDFISLKLVENTEAVDALVTGFVTTQPDHLVFIAPMGELHQSKLTLASTLLAIAARYCRGLLDCTVCVKDFEGFEHDVAFTGFRERVPVVIASNSGESETLALYFAQDSYLTWRMSTVLSTKLNVQVGIDRYQFTELQSVAVASCFREPVPDLRVVFGFASNWESTNVFPAMSGKSIGIKNKLDTYQELAKALVQNPGESTSQEMYEFRDPDVSPSQLHRLAIKHHGSSAAQKLKILAALGFLGNPFQAKRVMGTSNREWFRNQGFRGNREQSPLAAEACLGRSISELYELGADRLVPLITEWQANTLTTVAGPFKAVVHKIVLSVLGNNYRFQIPGVHDTLSWLGLQRHVTAIGEPNVFRGTQPVLRGVASEHGGMNILRCSGIFPEAHMRAVTRLADKGYIVDIHGTHYLTEFGAVMLAATESGYGKFLADTRLSDTHAVRTLDELNAAFTAFKSRCDDQLPNSEERIFDHCMCQHEVDGVNQLWHLQISTKARKKRVFWKGPGKQKRPVDLNITFDRNITSLQTQLVVARQYGYETQDALGETRYLDCTCGGIVGYRELDDGISNLICPGCGQKHKFFLIPKSKQES